MDEYQTDVEQDLREKKLLVAAGIVATVLIVTTVLLVVSSCMVVSVNNGTGEASPAAISIKPSIGKSDRTPPTREEYDP